MMLLYSNVIKSLLKEENRISKLQFCLTMLEDGPIYIIYVCTIIFIWMKRGLTLTWQKNSENYDLLLTKQRWSMLTKQVTTKGLL